MKAKYWARETYSKINPVEYTLHRFTSPSGRLIDDAEKKSVLNLLFSSGINNKRKLKILDVATGPGRLAFFLEEHLEKAEITGVDINENMLRRAKQIAQKNDSKVKFVKGDIYNLPFQNSRFDVVVGLRFSMHLPRINKAIEEFSRVLKDDGILIFDIFNYRSILRLKLGNMEKKDCGYYKIEEITKTALNYGLKRLEHKGILFFGETLLRQFPDELLFLLSPLIYPPKLMEDFSSKLVLCFKKL